MLELQKLSSGIDKETPGAGVKSKEEEVIMKARSKLHKVVEMLKNEENILFFQLNRFNNASFFEIRQEDRLLNYETWDEKVKTDEIAKEFFFKDSDFVNFYNSINTVKFLLYQIIFKEYQFFIFDTLSRQSFIGNYILGYEIDRFFSRFDEKEPYLKKVEEFRRSIKKFRKNREFKRNDTKFLNLLNVFVQDGLVKNIVDHLKVYYREERDLQKRLDLHGIKIPNKHNTAKAYRTLRSMRTIKTIKTNKSSNKESKEHKDKDHK